MSDERRERVASAGLTEAQAQRLADYSAGRLSPHERLAVEREILASPAMASALYEDAGIQSMLAEEAGQPSLGGGADGGVDPDAGHKITSLDAHAQRHRVPRWWQTRSVLAVAAGLVLVLLTPQLLRRVDRDSDSEDDFRFRSAAPNTTGSRAGIGAAGSAPRGILPAGDVATTPALFVWTRDSAADAYRVEVLGPGGRVVLSRSAADTSLALASGELALAPGDTASWRVMPFASSVPRMASEPTRFVIAR